MSAAAPFVAQLRSRPGVIRIGTAGPPISLRVQVPEIWDVVRIDADADTPVSVVKDQALSALVGGGDPSDWVVKLHGFLVLDESASVTSAGAGNGSTFLVTTRRRRPVR